MIGKVILRTNFNDCLNYVLGKPKTQIIGYNHLKPDNNLPLNQHIQQLNNQFQNLAKRSRQIEKPCLHLCLSPHPDDYPLLNNLEKTELASQLLNKLGYQDCQWLLAEHHDTVTPDNQPRPHLHLIVNRIPINDNKAVKSSFNKRKTEEALQELRQQFGLREVADSFTVEQRAPTTGEIRKYRKQLEQYQECVSLDPPELPLIIQLQQKIDQTIDNFNLNNTSTSNPTEMIEQFQQQLQLNQVMMTINDRQVTYSLMLPRNNQTQTLSDEDKDEDKDKDEDEFEYVSSSLGQKYILRNIIKQLEEQTNINLKEQKQYQQVKKQTEYLSHLQLDILRTENKKNQLEM